MVVEGVVVKGVVVDEVVVVEMVGPLTLQFQIIDVGLSLCLILDVLRDEES